MDSGVGERGSGTSARVAFYCDSLTLGGHERQAVELANALQAQRYAVEFWQARDDDALQLNPGITVRRLPSVNRTPLPFAANLNPFEIVTAMRFVKAQRPDLLVVAQGTIEIGIKGVVAGRGAGVRTVSYLPFGFRMSEMGARLGWVRDIPDSAYFRLPDAFITCAGYHRALLGRLTSRPIHVIPYPIDACPDAAVPQPARSGRVRFGVVGRVYFAHKNQDALVPMMQHLAQRSIDAEMHIIGDGPDLPRLRRLVANAGLERRFVFHGWVNSADVHSVARRDFDVWLMPSHFEGIPLVLLEAAALGKQFLISRLGFADEYRIPEEFLLDPGDPLRMALKVEHWLGMDHEAAYARVRTHILERHTRGAFVQNVRATFDALLAS